MLRQQEGLPAGFLDTPAGELHRIVPEPTLFHLPGRRMPPLFVSILLHGNEPVGLHAIQQVLAELPMGELPRGLSLFVGNVAAAREGVRRLEGQADFNRIWPGTEAPASPESRLAAEVVDTMASRGVFASVDIHNNTGLNPHYACINRLDHRYLRLATLFSRTVVYFIRPRGVQSMAFAELCPAVTLECGKPTDRHGVAHAADYVRACLNLAELPDTPVPAHDLDLFHTVAQVKIPPEVRISFGARETDLLFAPDLDHMNFRELPAGTVLGMVNGGHTLPITAHDEQGVEVSPHYFAVEHGRLVLTRPMMPSMLTLDERVIRQDCLCYLMERMDAEIRTGFHRSAP
ncbi:peptidase M14 [Ectothiorhodospira shaposhnikovii]|uniref:M14 family metallopeptidase n=1 Tax=Ectothiorhodospira shaposhnikovii TaxID=1054 RepID=UPI001905C7E8|nr:M14 family metallopeptidase [Ectothiorhodospira shaposhnikovii]MBK1672449.1 peptidase M14 [Ectothiorhodospira shaposhnikovii]